MLLRFHGLGADPEQIRHRFGAGPIDIPEMLRCAKELGLKARSRVTRWERLVSTPLPGIVTLRDGGFLLLAKVGDDKALVQSPLSPRPTMMTRAELDAKCRRPAAIRFERATRRPRGGRGESRDSGDPTRLAANSSRNCCWLCWGRKHCELRQHCACFTRQE
jgi:ABC-type bacteriocin/lantibiotic exporter with double-glycine peptidase domain